MRLLDLKVYTAVSLSATLLALAYSTNKSLFETPSAVLSSLSLLESLEPILKDVRPLGDAMVEAASASTLSSVQYIDQQLRLLPALSRVYASASFSEKNVNLNSFDSQDDSSNNPDMVLSPRHHSQQHHRLYNKQQGHSSSSSSSISSTSSQPQQQPHGDLFVASTSKGSAFRADMLAERYLRVRTPSPAVLHKLDVVLTYVRTERMCVVVFVNMALCLTVVLGRMLLKTFFGELRLLERQHMYDRALNFLLFKVVFVGAILEPRWEELLIWSSWFAILGCLRVFSMLCRDRFEFLTVSPNIPKVVHVKILSMLGLILVSNVFWFVVCISVFRSMLLLLSFECFTLFLDTVQTIIKYVIHLGDLHGQGPCESRRMFLYYTEFTTDTMILLATLGHYLHIMFLHGISFTLIDAVLFLNMRSVFNNLRKKVMAHQAYRSALQSMQALYPSATERELEEYSDDCAICRDSMTTSAKVLPCGHIFHLFCIRSWLENQNSCPTCRYSLVSCKEHDAVWCSL